MADSVFELTSCPRHVGLSNVMFCTWSRRNLACGTMHPAETVTCVELRGCVEYTAPGVGTPRTNRLPLQRDGRRKRETT